MRFALSIALAFLFVEWLRSTAKIRELQADMDQLRDYVDAHNWLLHLDRKPNLTPDQEARLEALGHLVEDYQIRHDMGRLGLSDSEPIDS